MPPSPLDKVIGLALASIRQATAAYQAGGSAAAWRAAMGQAIGAAHTAAAMAAAAERGAGGRARTALARLTGAAPEALLSARERAAVRAAVTRQLAYLDAFAAKARAGALSPAQLAARARQYAAGPKALYWELRWGDWEIPPDLLPGNQACLGSCGCRISVRDLGGGRGVLTRTLGGAERHCTTCPPLAGDHPIRRRQA